ncbi:hypothetical protein BUALT_Bualt10G0042800 [Buddleja alternifolia]|uniref:C2 domain-containing protein n=1 Tax=Buddleja alternifolia TaxID=168488 RepID=A0AAV6WV72_9LAMI|nr:hypothetical protein BUALT_Bualt10G0042800 [Buddleja alternifolia]
MLPPQNLPPKPDPLPILSSPNRPPTPPPPLSPPKPYPHPKPPPLCLHHILFRNASTGKGSDPEWNETFVFGVSDDVPELLIKIMDSDGPSGDDFVGEAKIPLEPLFAEGSIPPTVYNVVKDDEYCGEIKLGLNFTPEASIYSTFVCRAAMKRMGLLDKKKKAAVDGKSLRIEVHSTKHPLVILC